MNYAIAIVIAAGLIAGAFLTGPGQSQPPQPPPVGKYTIATDGTSKGSIWRVDTATGQLWHCYAVGGPAPADPGTIRCKTEPAPPKGVEGKK
jgi:hypothetical protein